MQSSYVRYENLIIACHSMVQARPESTIGGSGDAASRQNTLVVSVLGSAITVVIFRLASAVEDDMGLCFTFVVTYDMFAGGKQWLSLQASLG